MPPWKGNINISRLSADQSSAGYRQRYTTLYDNELYTILLRLACCNGLFHSLLEAAPEKPAYQQIRISFFLEGEGVRKVTAPKLHLVYEERQ